MSVAYLFSLHSSGTTAILSYTICFFAVMYVSLLNAIIAIIYLALALFNICDLIKLTNYGLPSLRNRADDLLNQIAALQSEKAALKKEIQRLRSSVYENKGIISRQIGQSRKVSQES